MLFVSLSLLCVVEDFLIYRSREVYWDLIHALQYETMKALSGVVLTYQEAILPSISTT